MLALENAYGSIKKELALVESLITDSLAKGTVSEIRKINRILLRSQGKRLRPAMIILSAYASKPKSNKNNAKLKRRIIMTAAAFELIHMATLVHDDVMDSSLVRHRKPTINAVFGENVSICAGDFLFAKAIQLLASQGDTRLIETASLALKEVCEGQILQLWRRHDFGMGMQDYMAIINKKTAALFSASCAAGAQLMGTKDILSQFGLHYGRAFQMIDDYLDIASDEKTLGKKPGENLRAGELTLPMLLLFQELPSRSRAAVAKKCMKDADYLKKMLMENNIGHRVREQVRREMRKAEKALDSAADSPYRTALHRLMDIALSRLKV